MDVDVDVGVAEGRADVAIVGGGLAGLSTAYHLIRERPGLDVALLEAGEVGAGSSGRSTGMLGPGVGGPVAGLRRRFGDEVAARMFEATLEGVRRAIRIVLEEALDCDLERTGQLKVALTGRQAAALEREGEALRALGFDVPFLEAGALRAAIGTRAYHGALRYEEAAALDPLKLCRELRRVLVASGVRVLERTRVRSVVPGRPARLETSAGAVLADRVVLATDAYTARLGFLAGRVVPVHTHVILTEPLARSRLPALGRRGREAIVDARRCFSYYRVTREDRILFGGARPIYRALDGDRRAGATEAEDPRAYLRLERELETLFPSLEGVRIERRWSGPMGFTLDRLPVVGELEGGVLFLGGWCGHGVALALASGAAVADLLAGRAPDGPRLPWLRGSAPRLPPDPLRSVGLGAYLGLLDLADRLAGGLRSHAGSRPPSRGEERNHDDHVAHLPERVVDPGLRG